MGTELARLFIAIEAPPEVRAAAEQVIARLRPHGDVRWTPADKLHLTLKFLGETPSEKISAVKESLGIIANIFSPFMVRLGGAGAFPSVRRPQVLWLSVEGNEHSAGQLRTLAALVDAHMAGVGLPREGREYAPHLTLGRVRSRQGVAGLARRLEELQAEPEAPGVEWPVQEIVLMQSRLGPGGAVYEALARARLGEPEAGLPGGFSDPEFRAEECRWVLRIREGI